MATHSNVLAWRIPGMAEPGGLPSMGSHRVGHDWSGLAATAAMLFIATWMDLEIIILSEVSQRKTNITHIWKLSFKKDTTELTEIDLQILKTNLWLREEGWNRNLGWTHTHTLLYMRQMINRTYCIAQGPLPNIVWQPLWEKNLKKNEHTCVCVCVCVCVYN